MLSDAEEIFIGIRGLEKEEQKEVIIYRNNNVDNELIFSKRHKNVSLHGFNALDTIDVKAIYLKMKELGWI